MKYLSITFFLCLFNILSAQQKQLDIFTTQIDIGNPSKAGSTTYDHERQIYTLKSGVSPENQDKKLHFTYHKLSGNFILTAQFELNNKESNSNKEIGWMIRTSTNQKAKYLSVSINGDGTANINRSSSQDSNMHVLAPKRNYQVLQMERSGQTFLIRGAHLGEPLQQIGIYTFETYPEEILGGLFISSQSDHTAEALVWNVRIDRPVSDDYRPQRQGWLGCRLETMDIFDGRREVIFTKNDRFEAPNWMPDGKKLLFNMDGSLYTIPIKGGEIEQLDTGEISRNNNDHGISFDGKTLAISSHRDGFPGGGSTIYTLPLEGGKPTLITENTPSYWHGWAPNNRDIVYVAQREGQEVYNIYKKDISGGDEIALTDLKPGEHADGCEYSPDGEFVYYNASYSGTMQIWRMKPDGSAKEQITFDQYNDWFPHISPDGKWMLFLSYPADIPSNSHPSFKRVMLRLMPIEGGSPRVIAYLYGGQGTINVPSWSPDSRRVAFVSNSGK